jgi:hypothetical protein
LIRLINFSVAKRRKLSENAGQQMAVLDFAHINHHKADIEQEPPNAGIERPPAVWLPSKKP